MMFKNVKIYVLGALAMTSAVAVAAPKPAAVASKVTVAAKVVPAVGVNAQAFELIDLDRKGLEEVKALHAAGKDEDAAVALLKYFRERTGVVHPEVNLEKVTISKEEQKWADESLEHKFFAHKGYQPSYFYGDDIDWTYWPVQDNELRWQLHRQKWFIPLGKAYRMTGDEKYAKAWSEHFMDWIVKNPLLTGKPDYEADQPGAPGVMTRGDQYDNMRFAWRPLEVSNRLQDQPAEFLYFMNSPYFTPDFLTDFIVNYYKHANHIMHNFSKTGNHLLFEAQRMVYAGTFFPEFKDAERWRKAGIDILNKEIGVQVYDDGMQFELDLGYHEAAINIFFKALNMAKANGFENEFPASYLKTIEKMIVVVYNTMLPDYTHPMFSDAKRGEKAPLVRNYKTWQKVYPQNKDLLYMAWEGQKGKEPQTLSKAFKTGGFFVLRNGWTPGATVMVVKAGPPAFWHNQPDNGTFELALKGRNFFPDSGTYVYAGDAEVMKLRNWFRQTRVHNTLTLNNADLDSTHSKCLLFDRVGTTDRFVTQNPSYKGLDHRRSVFFVDGKYFVIVDEAVGNAKGEVNLHYGLIEGDEVMLDAAKNGAYTRFDDKNNMRIETFGNAPMTFKEEEGWVSYGYRVRVPRKAYSLNVNKESDAPVRFITVIVPVEGDGAVSSPKISAKFLHKEYDANGLKLEVKVGKEKRVLEYAL